jgi:hypothetical protein
MKELFQRLAEFLLPWGLGAYAVAFLSGGVYYLEQRVARIGDQFPRRRALAVLYGCTALAIGVLASATVVLHFVSPDAGAQPGAVVAIVSGVAFWAHRLRTALTPGARLRAGVLAALCAALAVLSVLPMRP